MVAGDGLTFNALRRANVARLPLFKNKHGEPAHSKPDGSDWNPGQWMNAVVGELGELANIRKKFERGDLTFEQFAEEAAKELADVQTYLDILALRILDKVREGRVIEAHPDGVNLGWATRQKWNEVSKRVGCPIRLHATGHFHYEEQPSAYYANCVVCHQNPVDVQGGYDTCDSCLKHRI